MLIENIADFLDSELVIIEESINGFKDSIDRDKSELHIRMAKSAMKEYIKTIETKFPTNVEIFEWWKTQKFQKEQGEQEYTLIYETDLPKILKAFSEHFIK